MTISAGKTTPVNVVLTPSQKTGYLTMYSTPKGAEIYIDMVDTGKKTNTVKMVVDVGQHILLLNKTDYKDYQKVVTIYPGRVTTVNARLTKG